MNVIGALVLGLIGIYWLIGAGTVIYALIDDMLNWLSPDDPIPSEEWLAFIEEKSDELNADLDDDDTPRYCEVRR